MWLLTPMVSISISIYNTLVYILVKDNELKISVLPKVLYSS